MVPVKIPTGKNKQTKTPTGCLVYVNKLIPKFTWRSQRTRIADTVLKKGNKVGAPMIPNFKTYCRATVGTSGGPVAKMLYSSSRSPGLIPSQGTRSHMQELRSSAAK